ncbi:MAG: acyl transferase [Saprospirales bacterium]|nr:MAG: acyl transferase [Saprospirales bacterium]
MRYRDKELYICDSKFYQVQLPMNYQENKNQIKNQLIGFIERGKGDFDELAVNILKFQLRYNSTYRRFFELLGYRENEIKRASDLPCFPVSFLRGKKVAAFSFAAEKIFFSSGTTDQIRSEHHIPDLNWYEYISTVSFVKEYGSLQQYNIIGLLPNYMDQKNSSLIHMIKTFMEFSPENIHGLFSSSDSDFFSTLQKALDGDKKTILIGVSFALLDFAKKVQGDFSADCVIMETGGMKGRRKELVREELHSILSTAFNTSYIHSEYGMTELQSQAYSKGKGIYKAGPLMKVFVKEINDCKVNEKITNSGLVHIIDLANFETIPFVATNDIGTLKDDDSFEILGRMDGSELRGCNLMYGNF